MSMMDVLLGRRIANREAERKKLNAFEGLPAMGLDGLGSAAYGPEAALAVLAVSGAAGLAWIGPIFWVILALLAILAFSYWQTIEAYPTNGGSYTVARENLGANTGLVAAAALMIDYTLNVAVGISAGVGALTSALPALHPYTLWLCLAILAVITVVNLRGTRDSGIAWSLPTYTFIVSLGGVLAWGVVKAWVAGGHPQPVVAPPALPQSAAAVALWLVLRAFASGCTAMTGVEAVSNGVSAFREPRIRHAHATLAAIVAILGLLLVAVAYLARSYGIVAMDQGKPGYQSVLSQIVGAVYGRGWLYYVTIGSVLAVLCLSASTSFVDFPRVCRLVARDDYLPRGFAMPGRRLVYSVGVLFLAGGAGLLLLAFEGITDRLIPLFAVGAFAAFTLSQAGMAVHWWRAADRVRMIVNGVGAAATGSALVIILAAKFVEGAWLTVIVVPLTVLLLRAIHAYYAKVDRQILSGRDRCIDLGDHAPPAVLIPIERWDAVARAALQYAFRISPQVTALHFIDLEGPDATDRESSLRDDWRRFVEQPAREAGLPPPRLIVESSQYRSVLGPLLREIETVKRRMPGRPVAVVLPQLVEGSWWETLLHTHRERRLRRRLMGAVGPDLAVVGIAWPLASPEPERVLKEEEPAPA